jgi:hypothetical protein
MVFGKFTGGDFCLLQLGIQVPMPAGSIVGIRGSLLKHFVAPWEGYLYSVIHFFKESLRPRLQKKERPMKTEQTAKMETKGMRAGGMIDLKESMLDFSKRAKQRQHTHGIAAEHVPRRSGEWLLTIMLNRRTGTRLRSDNVSL